MNKAKIAKTTALLATGAVIGAVGTPIAAVAAVVHIKPLQRLVAKGVENFVRYAIDPRNHIPKGR